jgi:hypothetical protein
MCTRSADISESFIELVCQDEEWLRAEFDALIAAGWDTPSQSPPTAPRAERPRPPGRPGPAHSAPGFRPARSCSPRPSTGRSRSPPEDHAPKGR